LVGM